MMSFAKRVSVSLDQVRTKHVDSNRCHKLRNVQNEQAAGI